MRALIVDDSRFLRGFLRGILEEKGIELEFVEKPFLTSAGGSA